MRKRTPQLSFTGDHFKTQLEFGGSLLKKSHAKCARPISTKHAMHLTLRSSQAKGSKSFLAGRRRTLQIEHKVHVLAKRFGVRIYRYANAGNHLHLLIRVKHRRSLQSFLRSLSGVIARLILQAEKGRASLSKGKGFWDQRPWTRIVQWQRDFASVKAYVDKNFLEAMGFISYQPRNTKLISSA